MTKLMALAYEERAGQAVDDAARGRPRRRPVAAGCRGDIGRFPDGDHAASYLGLTPRLRQSAAKRHSGGITKAGCPQTRAMLVQAVPAASDHPGPIGAFFRRLRKKKKYNVVVIATAQKLVTVAYLMLKHNEPYRSAKPDVVKDKLADCRRKAGQAPDRAKVEGPDGSRLNDLDRNHGMPTCQPPAVWSAGERRALGDPEVAAFADRVHQRPDAKPRVKRVTTQPK